MANNPKYANLTEVGVGAVTEESTKPLPLLDDAGEYEYITLHNPLPFTFKGKVAISRPVNVPLRVVDGERYGLNESGLRQSGLDLKNPEHISSEHVANVVSIESGQSQNFLGSEAKVIIRQLTNEVMHYEGNTLRIGNLTYRREVETRLVVGRHSVNDLLGARQSEQEIIRDAVDNLNEEAFPTVQEEVRRPGRPKKDE